MHSASTYKSGGEEHVDDALMNHVSMEDVHHDSQTEVCRAQISDETPVSTLLVHTVAAARDVDPLDVARLNDVVDPEALNRLFRSKHDGTPRSGGVVRFAFDGCDVTVADGEIVVRLLDD